MVWGFAEAEQAKSADASEADYPECDYDTNLSPLYEAIEERAWIAVNQFLHNGYWPESFFTDNMLPEDQARTWVTRYETRPDGTKKVRWSQLPIHAAVIFGAPSVVIQQLVEAFPQSIRCTDDHRMLPLHLAFRHGSDDSVLALFLEEFPEAVNVRGYKGRMPVECAVKGPNPERGAIIQTILQKNHSAWERKKSAVQLKELYCVKEALKIKGQKVSHLETAVREIKSREHKTRRELGLTMTELKVAKVKSKNRAQSPEDNADEKMAVRQLVEKLAALEMATKDLVCKEKQTKKELKKTMGELEAAKRARPTEDQAKQFARLDQVASVEQNVLARTEEDDREIPRSNSKVSFKGNESVKAKKERSKPIAASVVAHKPAAAPAAAAKKPGKDAKSVATAKSTKSKGSMLSRLSKKSKSKKARAAPAPPTPLDEPLLSVSSFLSAISSAVLGDDFTGTTAEAPAPIVKPKVAVATKAALVEKIATLETAIENNEEKSVKAQEDLDVASVQSNKKLNKQQKAEMTAMQAEMKALKESGNKTKDELSMALRKLDELQNSQDEKAALEEKIATLETALENNKEKSLSVSSFLSTISSAVLGDAFTGETALENNKEKSVKAQEDLDVASVQSTKKLNKKQMAEMTAMQADMKALKESGDKTKDELGMALRKLDKLKNSQDQKAIASVQEKTNMKLTAKKNNHKLENKVALLELALKQFDDKANMAKQEMQNIKQTISQDDKVVLTPAQEKYIGMLEKAMKKLEKNAKNTKMELDSALSEMTAMKAKEGEVPRQHTEATNAADKASTTATKEATEVAERAEQGKLQTVEQANRDLELKIATLEATMSQFEQKASKTKGEMEDAMNDLKASDASTVATETSIKLTKKQKKHMQALEDAMKKLEDRANSTRGQLDSALTELNAIKKDDGKDSGMSKKETKALKDLSKKVQVLQSAMVGFEVKETKTMQELEKTMKELEDVSNKRFEVLSVTAEHTQSLSADNQFNKEVTKLEKRAGKEEKRMAELEAAVQDIVTKSGSTKDELERTKQLLDEIQNKTTDKGSEPLTQEEKEEARQDKKLTKELMKKVQTLQSAVIGFEVKETRTMKELEHTMKQLEELTSKRFEVLEKASALKEKETERLVTAGALAEEKVAALHSAMKELEQNSALTHSELEKTKVDLNSIKTAAMSGDGVSRQVIDSQEKQIKELHEKIGVLQQAVMGFEVKETKTMQELEQTMKQLEELTAKRFEVLQKVAGREIEAAKTAEATKYSQKSEQEEKKVAALESAMRELESKAYKTKLELEKTMKSLEHMEQNQTAQSQEVVGISKEEKRVMRELVSKVADIQEAVMAYDDKELKTIKEMEATKQELEATKEEVEELRAQQTAAIAERGDVSIIATDDKSTVEAVKVNDNDDEQSVAKSIVESAQRATEETLSSLETAIQKLVQRLDTEAAAEVTEEAEKAMPPAVAEEEATTAAAEEAVASKNEAQETGTVTEIEQPEEPEQAEEPMQPVVTPPEVTRSAPTLHPVFAETPAQVAKPEKRRSSFFGRFAKKSPKKSVSASTSSKKSSSDCGKKMWNISLGKKKSTTATKMSTAAATITPQQRRMIEATHGNEIAAVLTDQQILDIISKMDTSTPMTETPAAIEAVMSGLSKSGAESIAKSMKSMKSSAAQSTTGQSTAKSVLSSGIKEADPQLMVVSLPSTRSVKSAKSSKSQKSIPTSPSKLSSIAPVSMAKSASAATKDALVPLVAEGTYDDGFEINF